MSKYFANIHTTDALKKAYKELCLKLHPDKGGDAADFIAMKDEYKAAAKRVAWEEAHSTDEEGVPASDKIMAVSTDHGTSAITITAES